MEGKIYQQMIRERLARIGRIGMDPRHVEGFMRLEYGCLDGLGDFDRAVRKAVRCVEEVGSEESEQLALSYAL